MAVYVDSMRAGYGRMIMCHMVADTTDELLAMADQIGVARRWLQDAGTHREHFDVCQSKRAQAVKAGAVEVSMREVAVICRRRRDQQAVAKDSAASGAPEHPNVGGVENNDA